MSARSDQPDLPDQPAPALTRPRIHRRVRQPIGVFVRLAADVLERDAAEGGRQQAGLGVQRLQAGDFYILCPDNDVPRAVDERRILWAVGDIVENRPALSRWHPDYAAAFKAFMERSG